VPYITPKERIEFESLVDLFGLHHINSPSKLNYLVTQLIRVYQKQHKTSYQTFNDILGVLEGVKLELYRRRVAPYEDEKITKNGNV